MRDTFLLVIPLLPTCATFLRPGGVRTVAAESLLLTHQVLINQRSSRRAPPLISRDHFLLGLTALFLNPPGSQSLPSSSSLRPYSSSIRR